MKNIQRIATAVLISCIASMTAYAAPASQITTSTEDVVTGDVEEGPIYDGASEEVTVSVSQGSSFTVTIPKTITLAGAKGNENSAAYTVTVTADIPGDEFISVEPDSSFNMSSTGKADISAEVSQTYKEFGISKSIKSDATKITLTELMGGVSTPGKVSVEKLTSGNWTGSFNFNISCNK